MSTDDDNNSGPVHQDPLEQAKLQVDLARQQFEEFGPGDSRRAMHNLMMADTLAQIDMAQSLRMLAYQLTSDLSRAITEGMWNARPH